MESNIEAKKPLRFFIALVPPQPIQTYANEIKQYFAEHYHSRKAFNSPPHITLQPPFEWPANQVDTLSQGITDFVENQPIFPVFLEGFATFPPRVIYMNVLRSDALMAIKPALMDFMETRFDIVDKKDQNRPFKPHLTVAFRDLKPAAFRKAWSEFQDKAVSFEFMATHLTLLRHNGQRWIIQSQHELAQSTQLC